MYKRKSPQEPIPRAFLFPLEAKRQIHRQNAHKKSHTERVSINKGIEKGEKNGMDKLPRKIL